MRSHNTQILPAYEHALISISGDCAAGGMGETDEVIPFKPNHRPLIKEFLNAQLAWDIQIHLDYGKFDSKKTRGVLDHLNDCYAKLMLAHIFQHKFHCRTTWRLAMKERGSCDPSTR